MLSESWHSWEGVGKAESHSLLLVGKAVLLCAVGLHMSDEVDEVAGLNKLAQVLGIDHIAQLVLDLDHELDRVQLIHTMVQQHRVQGQRCLLCASEVVPDDGENVLLDLLRVFEYKCVFLVLLNLLPEVDLVHVLSHQLGFGLHLNQTQLVSEESHWHLALHHGAATHGDHLLQRGTQLNGVSCSGEHLY